MLNNLANHICTVFEMYWPLLWHNSLIGSASITVMFDDRCMHNLEYPAIKT